jgi:hypothetical protein
MKFKTFIITVTQTIIIALVLIGFLSLSTYFNKSELKIRTFDDMSSLCDLSLKAIIDSRANIIYNSNENKNLFVIKNYKDNFNNTINKVKLNEFISENDINSKIINNEFTNGHFIYKFNKTNYLLCFNKNNESKSVAICLIDEQKLYSEIYNNQRRGILLIIIFINISLVINVVYAYIYKRI